MSSALAPTMAASVAEPTTTRPTTERLTRGALWIGFSVAGLVWTLLEHSPWYHGDDWLMLRRSFGEPTSVGQALEGFNGHIVAFDYLVYTLQYRSFGVEGTQLVWLAFALSLVALQMAVAVLLRRFGAPTMIALLLGSLVAYFGPGAQTMVWGFMLGANLALAAVFLAAAMVLGGPPSRWRVVGVAALMVVAFLSDSALATVGTLFVGVTAFGAWSWRRAAAALVPGVLLVGLWHLFGDVNALDLRVLPITDRIAGMYHLVAVSAGGLLGVSDTATPVAFAVSGRQREFGATESGEIIGVAALVLIAGLIALGLVKRQLPKRVVLNLVGATAAAVVLVAAFAQSRLVLQPMGMAGSRFVNWTAAFLAVGIVPALISIVGAFVRDRRWRVGISVAAAAGLVAVFIASIGQIGPVRGFEQAWGANVQDTVRQTVTLVQDGCPDGSAPPDTANPAGLFATEVGAGFVRGLLAGGKLPSDYGIRATRNVVEVACVPR